VTAACALAGLALAAGLLGQEADGAARTATGQLLSVGNTSIVVRGDDGTDVGPIIVSTTTQLPRGLAAGDRVTVYYRPVADRQLAERVVLATAPHGSNPAATRRAPE
jgi:hypothetical protein